MKKLVIILIAITLATYVIYVSGKILMVEEIDHRPLFSLKEYLKFRKRNSVSSEIIITDTFIYRIKGNSYEIYGKTYALPKTLEEHKHNIEDWQQSSR